MVVIVLFAFVCIAMDVDDACALTASQMESIYTFFEVVQDWNDDVLNEHKDFDRNSTVSEYEEVLESLWSKYKLDEIAKIDDLLALSMTEYSGLESRAVPIIGITDSKQRLFVYNKVQSPITNTFPLNLYTFGRRICSGKKNIVVFRQECDEFILSNSFPSNGTLCNIESVLASPQFEMSLIKYEFPNHPTIYLQLQRAAVSNRNNRTNRTKRVGHKYKAVLLDTFSYFYALSSVQQSYYHQLSRHITSILHQQREILGVCYYGYKYAVGYEQFEQNTSKYALCIEYDPLQQMQSVVKYYSTFDQEEISKQQNEHSAPQTKVFAKDSNTKHRFYLGLHVTLKGITEQEKEDLMGLMRKWSTGQTGYGVVQKFKDKIKMYGEVSYVWRGDPEIRSESQLRRELKIVCGLRPIPNETETPEWITWWTATCRERGIIRKSYSIHQFAGNLYFNGTKKPIAFSGLDAHHEDEKFDHEVNSLSMCTEGVDAYLAFNLQSSRHDGDVRVPLLDRSALSMKSCVTKSFCFVIFAPTYKDIALFVVPSWAGSIASHCISRTELIIPAGGCRIVVLFRMVTKKNIAGLIEYAAKHHIAWTPKEL